MNRRKLVEILELVNEMTADVNGEYPIGLIRVRHLVIELIADKPAPEAFAVPYIAAEHYCTRCERNTVEAGSNVCEECQAR